jgi:hypothetical protein
MGTWVGTAISGRLEELAVRWIRLRRPLLRIVPAALIRPVIKPKVVRLRRSLARGGLAAAVVAGTILTLLIVVP